MGGVAKTVQSVAGKTIGAIVTGGTSLIPGSPTARIGGMVGSALTGDVSGLKSAFSGQGYTPQMLPQSDPAMQLAQTGGAQLLTNVALGTSVDDALAGYFGRTSGADFNAWLQTQSPDQQAAIAGVKKQLTQVQQNTDLRNQAVQKVVNDFPNIVSMTAPKVLAAKQQAGADFDQASQGYIKMAMDQIAAKSGGSGTVSSGANLAAAARVAADTGIQKLQYQTEQGNQALGLLGQDWTTQYTEANALRSFQQKMLGQGATQGFSAAQDALNRAQQTNIANTGAVNQAAAAKAANANQLTSSILGMAGTAGILGLTGGFGGAAKSGAAADSGGISGTDAIASGAGSVPTGANANPANYGLLGTGYR